MSESQALVTFELRKSSNELDTSTDVVIHDTDTCEPVVWDPVAVEAPGWFCNMVKTLDKSLSQFGQLVHLCRKNEHEIKEIFPKLTQHYEGLLHDHRRLYELAQAEMEQMRYASEEAFWQLSVASTQLSDQVSTAILAAQTTDKAQFKHLVAVTEALDANATHVMAVMNEFAATKDAEIKVLQNSSTVMKADIAALRKEVKHKPKAADVKKQEKKLQEFFDTAIKKAKESANPIALVDKLEGLAPSIKEVRYVKEVASLREELSVKKGKAIDSDPERPIPRIEPDSEEGAAAPPLRPFRLELYDPGEDGEEEADRAAGGAGGGGRRRTGGVGGGASPPGSPRDMSSDEGSPSPPPSRPPRWSATLQRNPRLPSPSSGLWDRKSLPSPHKVRDLVRVTIE